MTKSSSVIKPIDVEFTDHGSIIVCVPYTDTAREWIAEHIPEDAMSWGGGIAIEARYAFDICQGMIADGLEVV